MGRAYILSLRCWINYSGQYDLTAWCHNPCLHYYSIQEAGVVVSLIYTHPAFKGCVILQHDQIISSSKFLLASFSEVQPYPDLYQTSLLIQQAKRNEYAILCYFSIDGWHDVKKLMLTVGCVSKSVPQGLSNSLLYLMIIFWSEAKVFITIYDESYESMSYVTYITYVHVASQMKTSKYAFYWLFYVFESMRKKLMAA